MIVSVDKAVFANLSQKFHGWIERIIIFSYYHSTMTITVVVSSIVSHVWSFT